MSFELLNIFKIIPVGLVIFLLNACSGEDEELRALVNVSKENISSIEFKKPAEISSVRVGTTRTFLVSGITYDNEVITLVNRELKWSVVPTNAGTFTENGDFVAANSTVVPLGETVVANISVEFEYLHDSKTIYVSNERVIRLYIVHATDEIAVCRKVNLKPSAIYGASGFIAELESELYKNIIWTTDSTDKAKFSSTSEKNQLSTYQVGNVTINLEQMGNDDLLDSNSSLDKTGDLAISMDSLESIKVCKYQAEPSQAQLKDCEAITVSDLTAGDSTDLMAVGIYSDGAENISDTVSWGLLAIDGADLVLSESKATITLSDPLPTTKLQVACGELTIPVETDRIYNSISSCSGDNCELSTALVIAP